MVHSPTTAALIKTQYGVEPVVLPFAQYRLGTAALANIARKREARRRLGVPAGRLLLVSFGNIHLAEAMQAPDFVRRVPDGLSCVLIAEAVLDIVESGEAANRPVEQAQFFARTHSISAYCERLAQALGLDVKLKIQ